MKGVLSVFTFGIGALCFVIFITVLKPNAISAVSGPSKPEYCNSEASPTHQNPLPLPLPAFARARRVEYSLARAFISDTDFEQMNGFDLSRGAAYAIGMHGTQWVCAL